MEILDLRLKGCRPGEFGMAEFNWITDGAVTVLNGAIALVGAFGGASYAFRLERSRKQQEQNDKQRAALNLAIFQLGVLTSRLLSYQRQFLDTADEQPGGNLFILPSNPVSMEVSFDYDALGLILESSDPDCLGQLQIAELKFRTATTEIDQRSALILEQVQPRLADAGLLPGQEFTMADLDEWLGKALAARFVSSSKHIGDTVKDALASFGPVQDRLAKVAKEVFPDQRVIAFKPLDDA